MELVLLVLRKLSLAVNLILSSVQLVLASTLFEVGPLSFCFLTLGLLDSLLPLNQRVQGLSDIDDTAKTSLDLV